MGMFDWLSVKYPLPEGAPGPDAGWQSKDTPEQGCERYEIREDGTLWFLDVEYEWVSDIERALGGYFDVVDEEWVPCEMTGEVRFYTSNNSSEWYEFSAYFVKGKLLHLETIHNPRPTKN